LHLEDGRSFGFRHAALRFVESVEKGWSAGQPAPGFASRMKAELILICVNGLPAIPARQV
jgi:hypothetical protein